MLKKISQKTRILMSSKNWNRIFKSRKLLLLGLDPRNINKGEILLQFGDK